jgi:prepilin-type N-terminal cleavage/methylation domain-containing protein
MKSYPSSCKPGFTLIETVIAIGVLAVLLTGFMYVFAPAAAGIRKALNVQEADRLASTLEQEMVTLRTGQGTATVKTGFAKAFEWIKTSNAANTSVFVYQYRGKLNNVRADGTPEPETNIKDKVPGENYVVRTMVRRKNDPIFLEDLPAIEGGIYLVKCTQLIFDGGQLKPGTAGSLVDPKGAHANAASSDVYTEAVIAFSADFFALPAKTPSYFGSSGGFDKNFDAIKKPIFTRNLAVRR